MMRYTRKIWNVKKREDKGPRFEKCQHFRIRQSSSELAKETEKKKRKKG